MLKKHIFGHTTTLLFRYDMDICTRKCVKFQPNNCIVRIYACNPKTCHTLQISVMSSNPTQWCITENMRRTCVWCWPKLDIWQYYTRSVEYILTIMMLFSVKLKAGNMDGWMLYIISMIRLPLASPFFRT